MTTYKIDFQPLGRRRQCQNEETLMACAHQCGVGISNICAGQGKCGSCKVQILSGTVSETTSIEMERFSLQELKDGWRLACQAYPRSDGKLNVPTTSMTTSQRIQLEGLQFTVFPEPPVQTYYVRLSAPSLSDWQADADRLLEGLYQQHGLQCITVGIDVLRDLSTRLRSQGWECQVLVRNDEVIALGQWPSRQSLPVSQTNQVASDLCSA